MAPVKCQEMGLKVEDLDVDAVSVPLVPPECTNLTPVAIYGDGNCLPRCASLFAFHTQMKHAEMRVRIVIKDGTYMGAWQMASLATILGRVVNSVYPIYAAETDKILFSFLS